MSSGWGLHSHAPPPALASERTHPVPRCLGGHPRRAAATHCSGLIVPWPMSFSLLFGRGLQEPRHTCLSHQRSIKLSLDAVQCGQDSTPCGEGWEPENPRRSPELHVPFFFFCWLQNWTCHFFLFVACLLAVGGPSSGVGGGNETCATPPLPCASVVRKPVPTHVTEHQHATAKAVAPIIHSCTTDTIQWIQKGAAVGGGGSAGAAASGHQKGQISSSLFPPSELQPLASIPLVPCQLHTQVHQRQEGNPHQGEAGGGDACLAVVAAVQEGAWRLAWGEVGQIDHLLGTQSRPHQGKDSANHTPQGQSQRRSLPHVLT